MVKKRQKQIAAVVLLDITGVRISSMCLALDNTRHLQVYIKTQSNFYELNPYT